MQHALVLSCAIACCLFLVAESVDKKEAVGPCVNGKCPDNHFCQENECFPNRLRTAIEKKTVAEKKLKGEKSIGSCVNGLCPNGYDCIDNNCYKSTIKAPQAIGPCVNQLCPEGYSCNTQENKCYP
ncbi:Protein K08D12.8 [Aphelenchoides avenae]|nr:Protein K08D12.8 [Aphelenchus avenae]